MSFQEKYGGEKFQLACAFGKIAKQPQFGGIDRRYSLWCSSCAYANGRKAYETGEDPRKTSAWFCERSRKPLIVLAVLLQSASCFAHSFVEVCEP